MRRHAAFLHAEEALQASVALFRMAFTGVSQEVGEFRAGPHGSKSSRRQTSTCLAQRGRDSESQGLQQSQNMHNDQVMIRAPEQKIHAQLPRRLRSLYSKKTQRCWR